MWAQILLFVIIATLCLLAWLFSEWLVTIIVVGIVALVALWVLGCIFTPAVPDRKCPECGEEGLVKIKKGEPLGVRCEKCGFVDEARHVAYLDEW